MRRMNDGDSTHDALPLIDADRRALLLGSTGAALAALAGCSSLSSGASSPTLGFKSVPASTADKVTVAEGYVAQVLAPWGEPCGIAGAPMPP